MDVPIDREMTRRLIVSHLMSTVDDALKEFSIADSEKQFIWDASEDIRNTHEPTWMHCARVGLDCLSMAKYKKLKEPQEPFKAGLLHDVGKTAVELDLLYKKVGFNDDDRERMRTHIDAGFAYLIAKGMPFTAEVIKRHHEIGDHFYDVGPIFSFESDDVSEYLIGYYAMLVNMADFHDAMMTRKNDRNSPGIPRRPTGEEGERIMLAHYWENASSLVPLLQDFYNAGIFGNVRGHEYLDLFED